MVHHSLYFPLICIQEHGVDFPVRGPEDQTPILTPPLHPPSAATTGDAALAAAGYIPSAEVANSRSTGGRGGAPLGAGAPAAGQRQRQQQPVLPEADPFAGMTEEDKLAVQAAMAEMDQEERAFRESGMRPPGMLGSF